MDASSYQQLLQDAQNDQQEAEQSLAELRQIRSYLRQKLKAAGSEGGAKYQGMLDEVQNDMAEAKRGLASLRSVAAYASRKLNHDAPPAVSLPDQDGESMEFPAELVGGAKPPKRPNVEARPATPPSRPSARETPRPAVPVPAGRSADSMPAPAPSSGSSHEGMQTIEFGPDGFPLR